jgi:hypothetical protein
MEKKLKYEMTGEQVNLLLEIINRSQFAGLNGAKTIISLVELLQSPLNAEELEKETYETLKGKFEKK